MPASRLRQLHELAPEFYATLPHARGWLATLAHYFAQREDFVYACQ